MSDDNDKLERWIHSPQFAKQLAKTIEGSATAVLRQKGESTTHAPEIGRNSAQTVLFLIDELPDENPRRKNPPRMSLEEAKRAFMEAAEDPASKDVARDILLEYQFGKRELPRGKTLETLNEGEISALIWRVNYHLKREASFKAHVKEQGRDWGVDGIVAYQIETAVRDALAEADTDVANALVRDPAAVLSSVSPRARQAAWVTPGWRAVLIFGESGIGDPYQSDHVFSAFDRAMKILAKRHGGKWCWESINAAVFVVYWEGNGLPKFPKERSPEARAVDEGYVDIQSRRSNPTEDTKRAAIGKYEEFWRKKPTKVGDFPSTFSIPTKVRKLGKGKHIYYDSLKKDPETLKNPRNPLSYIHEFEGCAIYACDGVADTDVPEFVAKAAALVMLGKCVGFAFTDDDGDHDAEGTDPLPDLYCTVDGRALLVIQSRRSVLAVIWGGSLGVEARGIVG